MGALPACGAAHSQPARAALSGVAGRETPVNSPDPDRITGRVGLSDDAGRAPPQAARRGKVRDNVGGRDQSLGRGCFLRTRIIVLILSALAGVGLFVAGRVTVGERDYATGRADG